MNRRVADLDLAPERRADEHAQHGERERHGQIQSPEQFRRNDAERLRSEQRAERKKDDGGRE